MDTPLVVAVAGAELVVEVDEVGAELVAPELVVLEGGGDEDEAELADRLEPELPQAVTPSSASNDADKAQRGRNAGTAGTVTPVTVARFRPAVSSPADAALAARRPGELKSVGGRGAPQAQVAT